MVSEGEYDLADRAYAEAFETDPTNTEVIWERALLLRQLGKTAQARRLAKQIAEGEWDPRMSGIKDAARQWLDGR
jgi:hypothetical protein